MSSALDPSADNGLKIPTSSGTTLMDMPAWGLTGCAVAIARAATRCLAVWGGQGPPTQAMERRPARPL
eukprot:3080574-Pyramimonas_sp.AAC.1